MLAICGECGLRTDVTPTGRSSWRLAYPRLMPVKCTVVAARLKEKGNISGDEMDCPHLSRAAQAAFQAWKDRR